MKPVLPFLALIVFATSCTTAYKSGQTPDDVYFSPERKINTNEYVQMNREDENPQYRNNRRSRVEDDYATSEEDRYLRMMVRNRRRWSGLDNYYNDPYAGGYYNRSGIYTGIGLYGGNFWSPYSYWNSFNNWNFSYNPYYMPHGNVIVVNPNTTPVYNRPRTFNLNTFSRSGSSDPKRSNNNYQTYESRPSRGSNAGSYGNDVRRSFDRSSSSSNSNYSAPSRSSSGSSGSSSGSSSSGSSKSAPVRKF